MVEGGGFEPPKLETADLQSALVGRLSIPPAQIKQGIFTESPTHVNLYFIFLHLIYENLSQIILLPKNLNYKLSAIH